MRAPRAPLRPSFSSARLCHVVYAGVLDADGRRSKKYVPDLALRIRRRWRPAMIWNPTSSPSKKHRNASSERSPNHRKANYDLDQSTEENSKNPSLNSTLGCLKVVDTFRASGIYRRYPLGLLPALRNAWRTARA